MIADPKGAAREAGYELTEEQVNWLKALDLASLSDTLEQRISKIIM